jgi:hypothetical protein
MQDQTHHGFQSRSTRLWSYRILAASLFGILFFTLFPYRIDFSRGFTGSRSPLLLGRALTFDGYLHTSLNTLLFVPFGFAISTFSKDRRKSWLKFVLLAIALGFLLSYSIEITQLYIPTRDSAWDDVIANTLGSACGMIFGLLAGGSILSYASEWEKKIEDWLLLRRILAIGLIYFGLWIAISIPLQEKTHLANWSPNSFLTIGNNSVGDEPWDGEVSRLLIWDKAITGKQAEASMESFPIAPELSSKLLAGYDLSQPAPIQNLVGVLPPLISKQLRQGGNKELKSLANAESSWLTSETSVGPLVERISRSNQLTIAANCVPSRDKSAEGTFVAISNLAGKTDFALKQEGSSLEIVLRTGLASKRAYMSWLIGGVFLENQKHSLVYSYDGADAVLYVDGKKEQRTLYILSPGAGLVGLLVRTKANELVAYSVLYDSLIFLPIGFLLGVATRRASSTISFWNAKLAAAVLLPSVLLECVLVWISGRQISYAQVGLTLSLTIAGIIWTNLDSPTPALASDR